MAIIYGQIESLVRLKETLHHEGIDEFASVKQIEIFRKNFKNNLKNIQSEVETEYTQEFALLNHALRAVKLKLERFKEQSRNQLDVKLLARRKKLTKYESKDIKNPFGDFFNWFYTLLLRLNIYLLEKSNGTIMKIKTANLRWHLYKANREFSYFQKHKEQIIESRIEPKRRRINYINDVLDELNPLIIGAKGENLVQKEISKLSDDYTLFNDFFLQFNPPIYNKKEKERIHSIQIDHVLVCSAGVFAIETKNWSDRAINNLRSPVKQMQRSGYALFTILNSKRNTILKLIHHWGKRTIPVKNLVVMIKNKPHAQFDYVTVKNLSELNRYLTYLKPIFEPDEVESIAKRIKKLGKYN